MKKASSRLLGNIAAFLGIILSFWTAMFLFSISEAEAGAMRVIVLTDAAGLGDKAFNDVCWQGVLKAKKDFGVDARFLQSREQADYASNLALAARRADLVVTLGYLSRILLHKLRRAFPRPGSFTSRET